MDLYISISPDVLLWIFFMYLFFGTFISAGRILFWHYVLIKKKYAQKYHTIGSLPLFIHPVIFFLWPRQYIRGYKISSDEEGIKLSCLPILPFEYNLFYFFNASRINNALIEEKTEYLYRQELAFIFERDYRKFDSKKIYKKQITFGILFILINPISWIISFPLSLWDYGVIFWLTLTNEPEIVELQENEN